MTEVVSKNKNEWMQNEKESILSTQKDVPGVA
jgi:hypothetical protein